MNAGHKELMKAILMKQGIGKNPNANGRNEGEGGGGASIKSEGILYGENLCPKLDQPFLKNMNSMTRWDESRKLTPILDASRRKG